MKPGDVGGADGAQASLEPPLHPFSFGRRLVGEGLATALLLAVVIGSGIMGERLAGGNIAIVLLGNTLATGAGLVVLITIFGPLPGRHRRPGALRHLRRHRPHLRTRLHRGPARRRGRRRRPLRLALEGAAGAVRSL